MKRRDQRLPTFDEAAGPTAADLAGFNNVGIHVNGPTVVTGKVDNALCFNGDNQYVQVRDHPEVNFLGSCVAGAAPAESFTIDAWIRADDVQGVRTILDKRVNPSDPIGYSLFIGNGRLGFQMADGSGGGGVCGPAASCQNYGEPTPSITPGNWHFIAVTVQRCDPNGGPGVGSLYVDGNLVLTFTPRTGNMNNPSDLFIGIRAPAFGPANFRGCIDELEYFKRALTPAEIQAIYNAGSAGKCKPCLHCPEDITVATCNPNGTEVCYQMPRECPGLTIRCEPPPCSFFPANTSTLVTCQAIDATGQTVERCQFAVTVLGDRERPTITCPPDLSGTVDPGQCSRFVTYPPIQASDNCPGVTVSCDPPSGFPFPVGTTTVTCTATDAAGNTNACTWTVTVRDHYNPTITCPQDITVRSCDRRTRVYYKPTATDNCPGVTVVCVPPSGSLFPAGSHPVTCTATDASGNTASCSFKVTVIVLPPPKLEITYIGQGMVRICWESECPDWRLQCTRSLKPAVMWQFVSAPVTTNGNRYCVTLPAKGAHQFYRLCRREPSPIEASDDLVPPLGTYRSPNDVVTAFIMGDPDRPFLMRGFAHPIPPNTPRRPPPCDTCPPEIHLIQTELSFQVSSDGGDTWLDGAAQSEGDVKIKPGALDRPGDGRDTEIMRLEAQGQVGGRPIRIRESPTLPSLGRTYIDPDSDGDGYSVDSFFDVFIEISMDGGNTWVPAETATPLDLLK